MLYKLEEASGHSSHLFLFSGLRLMLEYPCGMKRPEPFQKKDLQEFRLEISAIRSVLQGYELMTQFFKLKSNKCPLTHQSQKPFWL